MPKQLQVGDGFTLPIESVTHTFGLLAVRWAGKTNAARVLAEEMFAAGLPFVAVTPVASWWGLRAGPDGTSKGGLPIPIFGGPKGDVPLERDGGELVADTIIDQNLSCVVDLSSFDSDLKDGEAWAWSPSMLGGCTRFRFRLSRTFDSGATPKAGKAPKVATLADVDLDGLRGRMASTIARAKADDPRELKRQIAELQKQINAKPAAPAPKEKRVEVPVVTDKQLERIGWLIGKAESLLETFGEQVSSLKVASQSAAKVAEQARQPLAHRVQRSLPAPVPPPPPPRATMTPASSQRATTGHRRSTSWSTRMMTTSAETPGSLIKTSGRPSWRSSRGIWERSPSASVSPQNAHALSSSGYCSMGSPLVSRRSAGDRRPSRGANVRAATVGGF